MKTPVLKKTLAAFLLLFCLCVTLQPVSAASLAPPFGIRHYAIGEAKNFLLEDIDGEPFSLDSTRGRWVFLHFWASWCGPCREEMPTIQRLSEKMAGKPLAIVLVNTAEEEDDVFTFLSGIEVELNSLRDKDGQVTEVWKPRGLPTTFLIDPDGQVQYQAIGGRRWDQPEYLRFLNLLLESE